MHDHVTALWVVSDLGMVAQQVVNLHEEASGYGSVCQVRKQFFVGCFHEGSHLVSSVVMPAVVTSSKFLTAWKDLCCRGAAHGSACSVLLKSK